MHSFSPEVLQRQQIILALLGYYNGKCDGIWGPATVKAKQRFECSGKFNPGYPNNGMPFSYDGPFPDGIMRDWNKRGYITHVDLTEDYIKGKIGELSVCKDTYDPHPVQEEVKPVQQEPVKEVAPAAPAVEQPVQEAKVENKEPAPAQTTNQQNQQQNQHRNHHQNGHKRPT